MSFGIEGTGCIDIHSSSSFFNNSSGFSGIFGSDGNDGRDCTRFPVPRVDKISILQFLFRNGLELTRCGVPILTAIYEMYKLWKT